MFDKKIKGNLNGTARWLRKYNKKKDRRLREHRKDKDEKRSHIHG
tara:strand:+ start:153 stop:287 length:135 start_codon:yes stop_codon:yes gene_type:complete